MPFFSKHSIAALSCVNREVDPDSTAKENHYKLTLNQFRGGKIKTCPKTKKNISIFRFSQSRCKKTNSTVVEHGIVQQETMQTNAINRSASSVQKGSYSSLELSTDTSLSDSCQTEESCVCLLEDSYHPDKVHKRNWFSIKRSQSCKIGCSKKNDAQCRRSRKAFKESFTPLTRRFRRFLHQNSDDGIHYFFESRNCECITSSESFESIFGCNNSVCQACDSENNCLSIFSTPPIPPPNEICSSENCCLTDTTLIVVSPQADCCSSIASVFDFEAQDCSSAALALPCEGQECLSPANFVFERKEPQCISPNLVLTGDEQGHSPADDLILSCGAQECSSVSFAATGVKEPCLSTVDLVLGCELTECGAVCQALESTSPKSGQKSTLIMFENKSRLCSTNALALSSAEMNCASESILPLNNQEEFRSTIALKTKVEDGYGCALLLSNTNQCASTPANSKPPSCTSFSVEKHFSHDDETDLESIESLSSSEQECGSLDSGFLSSETCSFAIRKFHLNMSNECF